MHFSMRVDLSDFFNDARSYSLVFVYTSWENLKDLQDHIQNLFQPCRPETEKLLNI